MSIEVKVAEYCQDCPNFMPDVNSYHGYSFETKTAEYHHIITCSYQKECEMIRKYLESKMEDSHLKQTSK